MYILVATGKIIMLAVILTTVVVVSLTAYTFWAVKRGQDFAFLGPFLFAASLMLLAFALMQVIKHHSVLLEAHNFHFNLEMSKYLKQMHLITLSLIEETPMICSPKNIFQESQNANVPTWQFSPLPFLFMH